MDIEYVTDSSIQVENKMHHKSNAFTLIELMVTVAVVGILAAIAWPQFIKYQNMVARTDAVAGLNTAFNDLDKCAAGQGGLYTGCGLKSAQTQRNKYQLNLTVAADNSSFEIVATRLNGNDAKCAFSLAINSLGQIGIKNGNSPAVYGDSKQIRECWNK